MNKITVLDEYSNFSFDIKKVIKNVVNQTFKHLNIKKEHEISFMLTNEETIHEYNLKYRHVDRPTDVISFAYIDSCDDRRVLPENLGDIIICSDYVKKQALEYGHSELREFAFLVCHGTLHILGYDHMNPEDEKVMFSLQEEILNELNITRE